MFLFDFIPKSQCILLDQFRFVEQTEGMVAAKAPLCKGSSAEGGEGLLQYEVAIYMGTNANTYNFHSLCSTDHLPCPIKIGGLCSGEFLAVANSHKSLRG